MIGSVRVACCNAASAMLLLARITSGASTAERKRGTHFSLAADPSSLSKGVQGRWSQNFRWPVLEHGPKRLITRRKRHGRDDEGPSPRRTLQQGARADGSDQRRGRQA